jgi:integrase
MESAVTYRPPKVIRREVEALVPEQARAILAAFQGHRLELPVSVALLLGLRQGEVLGLRWSDVDLEHETVRVRNR